MAKLNGKPLWIARNWEPNMEPGENVWNSPYGDQLITQIKGTSRPWDEDWAFYQSEREARADATKRMDKVQKGKRAGEPNYDRRQS